MKVSQDEIEEIVDSVKAEPQSGKLTFVAKIIKPEEMRVQFEVVRVKGRERETPSVHKIKTVQDFSLYEIETNSELKKI